MRAYYNLLFKYTQFQLFLDGKLIKDHFSLKDAFSIKHWINIKDKTGNTATPIEEINKISTIDMAKAPIFYKE